MACGQNSDYCASKFATTGFVSALRFEIDAYKNPVKMTNFYPYYIDTGLFEGFKPKMRFIVPTLKADYVVKRMYQAILAEEKEVYIPGQIYWLKVLNMFLPSTLRDWLTQRLVGDGMEFFVGRVEQEKKLLTESKKTK